MRAAAVRSSKPTENRAAANSIFQNKSDPKGPLGVAANQPGPAANRRIHEPIQLILEKSETNEAVLQRLPERLVTGATYTYGPRATAHGWGRDAIRGEFEYHTEEVNVGEQQRLLVGRGRETGYAVWGCIIYNCWRVGQGEDAYFRIHVTHCHEGVRMG